MRAAFNGERLKKARIYRGMTVAEVAEKVGCQRQTLSMYEIGKSKPADEKIVENISSILRFPIKYFYETSENNNLGTVYFRSLLTTNKKYRTEQVVKMEFLSKIYVFLHDYIEFPEFEQPHFKDDITPRQAALELRKKWGLGLEPINNIITLIEKQGILASSFSTRTDDVDAFSQYIGSENAHTFIVAYSNNKTSASRIHFDIAHELGHICLHEWSDDIEELTKEEFKQREKEANEFAAEFLMPADTFKKDAEQGPQSIPYYKMLKKKWKVSIAAMIMRAKNLRVMTLEQYQSLIRLMQRRGQRKDEPLDDILITASPAMLKTAVIMLLQENVFTPKAFMDTLSEDYDFSINAEEAEYLLDLPLGTLTKDKIISFPNLQVKKK